MSKTTLSYADQINLERVEKDNLFKNAGTSPLTPTSLSNFTGLSYFAVDERFRLTGTISPDNRPVVVQLMATTGKSVSVEKFGIVRFTFEGQNYELAVFKSGSLSDFSGTPNQLFIPFKDLTSGSQTNANGRYLLVSINEGSTQVELDFNKAFNPLNSYNPAFESVLAPEASVPNVNFTVGQRKFEDRK